MQAQTTYTWQGNNALWQTPGEWSPGGGPPVAGDTALLNGNGSTIDFNANAAAYRVELGSSAALSQITLDLGGNTLTAGTDVSGFALRINSSATNTNNSLTITNGTVTLNEEISLQNNGVANVNTQLIVSGSAAILNTTFGRSIIGTFGRAEVIVENGATWNNQQNAPLGFTNRPDLDIGGNANQAGRFGAGLVRVTGAGSAFNGMTPIGTPLVSSQSRIRVGQEGGAVGAIEVLAGGTFEADVVNYSANATAIGTALISGNGSSYETKYTYLGGSIANGGAFTVGGSATMTVENSATATTELLRVAALDSDTFGKLALDNGTMSVTGTDGAVFDLDSHLEFTLYDEADPAVLLVTNGLTITNSVLGIQLGTGFSAAVNDVFTLASYGTRTGTFAGLNQDATFAVGAHTFRIDYGSGTADAISLTVIPEPSTAGLLLAVGAAAIAARRRRSSRGK